MTEVDPKDERIKELEAEVVRLRKHMGYVRDIADSHLEKLTRYNSAHDRLLRLDRVGPLSYRIWSREDSAPVRKKAKRVTVTAHSQTDASGHRTLVVDSTEVHW